MVQCRALLWQLCLLSIPLASALTVPQKVLSPDVSQLSEEELLFNATDTGLYATSSSDDRSCDNWDPVSWDYDVAIVGGGPAGLAASMSLGRVARTSLMYDSNEYRNAKTRYMHDVLGQDGMVPLKFRAAVRSEIDQHYSDYSYRTTLGKKVTAIQPLTKGFRVFDDKGGKILVKKVILATGITDVVPNKPGFSEAFGRGLFWCPWCDGYDYRGRAMVVYGKPGKLSSAIGSAISLRKLTTNIQIITGGKITDEDKKAAEEKWPGWEKVIKTTYGIKVHEVDITKLERTAKGNEPSDDEYKLTLSGAPTTLVANGILYSTDTKQTSSLHKQLHLDMDGSSVKVSSNNMMTSVGGIYAVGDANNDGSTNAYHAMWSAKRAVVNAHVALNKEEYLEQVPAVMVAAEGGDEEFYQRQIDELQWVMSNDIEDLYKTLGA